MNLAALDLNLLVALEALVTEAHVGRAARKVGLSQPAMSHALRRLREVLHDPLLVRVGTRMELTSRARKLHGPLTSALEQVRGLFTPDVFEPAASARRFRLMLPDIVVDLLLAPLVQRVGREAPGVRLDVIPWRGPELLDADFARTIDLAVSCVRDALPTFHRQRVYRDSDALAVRRGHPLAKRLHELDTFLAARHVAVIGHGARSDMVDDWLSREGHERRIAVVTPSYIQALHVAARSDAVAFVPRRLIAELAKPLALRLAEPPLHPGIDEQFMFFPAQAARDPASLWLRRHVLAIGKELDRVGLSGPRRRAA